MDGLRVSPWKRYGHDRLYVSLPDGTNVAWYDRKTGRLNLMVEEYRDRVLDALAPYLPAADARPSAGLADVALSPDEDLAANRPGTAVRLKLDELAPSTWRHLLMRMLGRKSEADRWRRGLKGERIAGAELERLTVKGWRVLHSVPLPRNVDIDHLLIGPGGVFCINTKHHPKAAVWVGDDSVRIGGQAYPYVRKSRAEAVRASRALTRGCGFTVEVHPLLVFVGTAKLTVVPSLRDVRAISVREIAALGAASGVLAPERVEVVHRVARDGRTWRDA